MWKVGQEVWCVLRGKGRVERLNNGAPVCSFNTSFGLIAYNQQGSIGSKFNRSLFFSKPKVEGATEPPFVPTLKKGDKLLLVDKEDNSSTFHVTVEVETEMKIQCVYIPNDHRMLIAKEHYHIYKLGEKVY